MPTPDPDSYADRWVRAWNRHDIEAVLDHFHEDVVFTSPVAARVVPESGGVVRGKAALRDYWTTALKALPELHFDIIGVYRGESTLVINYRNPSWRTRQRGADLRQRRPGVRRPRHLSVRVISARLRPLSVRQRAEIARPASPSR